MPTNVSVLIGIALLRVNDPDVPVKLVFSYTERTNRHQMIAPTAIIQTKFRIVNNIVIKKNEKRINSENVCCNNYTYVFKIRKL